MTRSHGEYCPRCGKMHEAGPYIERVDLNGIFLPADVECKCGVTLRVVVPIFKTTNSGYVWMPITEFIL